MKDDRAVKPLYIFILALLKKYAPINFTNDKN